MSASIQTCPVCNAQFEIGESECPRCGFKFAGETQAFKPVEAATTPVTSPESGIVPALEIVKGPYAGEDFILGQGTFTIGRDPSCGIFLNNMTVSRLHATIKIDNSHAFIVDDGSLNGTWVDGKVVDQAELTPGAHVQIGTFEMIYKHVAG